MDPRLRLRLACFLTVLVLAAGPLAMSYGSCVVMCDTCERTCPAAPGVAQEPRIEFIAAPNDGVAPTSDLYLPVAFDPPAPPPKFLLSA